MKISWTRWCGLGLSSQLNSAPVANQDPKDSGQREIENDLLLKARVMRRSRLYLDIGSYNKIHNCYCFFFSKSSCSCKGASKEREKIYVGKHLSRN